MLIWICSEQSFRDVSWCLFRKVHRHFMMVTRMARRIFIYDLESLDMWWWILAHERCTFHLFAKVAGRCATWCVVVEIWCRFIWLNLVLIIFSIWLWDMVILCFEVCFITENWCCFHLDLRLLSRKQTCWSFRLIIARGWHDRSAVESVSSVVFVIPPCSEWLAFLLMQLDRLVLSVRALRRQFLGADILRFIIQGRLCRLVIVKFIMIIRYRILCWFSQSFVVEGSPVYSRSVISFWASLQRFDDVRANEIVLFRKLQFALFCFFW